MRNKKKDGFLKAAFFKSLLFEHIGVRFHGLRRATTGADIIGRSGVAADKGVSHRGGCAEFNRHSYTNILGNRKNAGTVFFACTGYFPRHNYGSPAAFRERGACFGERTHRDRYANRSRLIPNGGACLIFREHANVHIDFPPFFVGVVHRIHHVTRWFQTNIEKTEKQHGNFLSQRVC